MNQFKEVRTSEHLTQQEMAKRLQVSLSHYTKLEGNFVQPSVDVLQRLKFSFPDVDMNKFFKAKKA